MYPLEQKGKRMKSPLDEKPSIIYGGLVPEN